MTDSIEQRAIFHEIEHGIHNIVVNAKAGSGKTTTAKKATTKIPNDKKIIYLAFNKSVADEMKKDKNLPCNLTILTFHGLGYRIIRETYPHVELDDNKYKTYLNSFLRGTEAFNVLSFSDKNNYKSNCNKLIDLTRYNKCQTIEEIEEVIDKYGINTIGNESETVLACLKWGKDNIDKVDYTDMEWLPYELNLATKRYKYDWIIIDEAQDCSPLRSEIYKKCYKRGTRFMAIGDKNQAINAWCGADESAFDNFMNEPNTITLGLSVSYRCPKKVIDYVHRIEPDIMAKENAIEGEVNENVNYYDVKSGDMVLCRNSAPLAVLCDEYLKRNIKAHIKGNDIKTDLIELVTSTGTEKLSMDLKEEGVMSLLYRRLLTNLRKIMALNGFELEEAIRNDSFLKQYDKIKTIEVLGNGTIDYDYLIDRIKLVYSDEENEGVSLSTVHKAKGLEADNVFILCPSLMPSAYAEKDWEIISERHLQYVAWSRAKKSLNFIDEHLFSPQKGFSDNASILRNIQEVNEKLKLIYNKDFLSGVEMRCALPKKQVSPVSRNISVKQPKPKVGANRFKNFLK